MLKHTVNSTFFVAFELDSLEGPRWTWARWAWDFLKKLLKSINESWTVVKLINELPNNYNFNTRCTASRCNLYWNCNYWVTCWWVWKLSKFHWYILAFFFKKSHTIFFGFKHIPAWIWDTIFFRFKPKIWPQNKNFFSKNFIKFYLKTYRVVLNENQNSFIRTRDCITFCRNFINNVTFKNV